MYVCKQYIVRCMEGWPSPTFCASCDGENKTKQNKKKKKKKKKKKRNEVKDVESTEYENAELDSERGRGVAEREEELIDQFNDKTEYSGIPQTRRSAPFVDRIAVSLDGMIKLLKGWNPSNALGPDELNPRVLKELANK